MNLVGKRTGWSVQVSEADDDELNSNQFVLTFKMLVIEGFKRLRCNISFILTVPLIKKLVKRLFNI